MERRMTLCSYSTLIFIRVSRDFWPTVSCLNSAFLAGNPFPIQDQSLLFQAAPAEDLKVAFLQMSIQLRRYCELFIIQMQKSHIEEIFQKFNHGQPEMEGKTFVKLFKDSKLEGKDLSTTDLDITFSKYKTKGAKKINKAQFQQCIEQCAKKKKKTKEQLLAIISGSGPKYDATKADNVKFHDDKNLYTGVYKQGGPSTNDTANKDLSSIVNNKK